MAPHWVVSLFDRRGDALVVDTHRSFLEAASAYVMKGSP